MTVRTVERGGVALHVHDDGPADGRAVLLLHGFPDTSDVWIHQRTVLVDAGFRVVAPDQRGLGASGRPTDVSAYALSELVADVVAILDACGIGRAAVVGHDIGAVLAWSLAVGVPDRVDRVMGMAVGFPCGGFGELDLAQWQHWWYMLLFQEPGVAEEFLPQDDWRALRALLSDHPDPDAVCRSLEPAGALTASIAWYRANVAPRQWATPRMPAAPLIRMPAWGVWSSGDSVLGAEQMTRTADYCGAGWNLETIDGAGHWFPLTHPEATNAALLEFLTTR